jgi:hypothetical protein
VAPGLIRALVASFPVIPPDSDDYRASFKKQILIIFSP